jgi:hypothetical protein
MIGGGKDNLAGDSTSDENSAYYATVGGGFQNRATGRYSTVPGGNNCTAAGQFSFAAGKMAKANHDGCFVWGDNTTTVLGTWRDNQFIARASGGVVFWSNSLASTGVTLLPNEGSWQDASSRHLKTDFEEIDAHDILARVSALPLYSWRYKAGDENVRHMGPASEDFYGLFKLGPSDKGITTVDANGVALAAIKALAEENRRLRESLEDLSRRLEELETD